ncbi:MAG: hypothetical protein QUU85_08010, partial [Candidatus Eisenbacteria bacterium]|nr:hypothetical protein [Candidatus Eisenbacteria bacterium]
RDTQRCLVGSEMCIRDSLGLLGLAQTATFAWLGLRHGWEYRRGLFVLPLVAGAAATAVLAGVGRDLWILLCAPAIGYALGVAFTESFFHSIHRERGRGRNTGVHEALLGAGTFLLPLAGGLLVPSLGDAAPLLLAAAALAGVAILSLALLRGVGVTRPKDDLPARASS